MSLGRAVDVQKNQECRRLLVVADEVRHQDIKDVIVDRNGLVKARHPEKLTLYR